VAPVADAGATDVETSVDAALEVSVDVAVAEADPVVGRAGGVELRLSEYGRALSRMALFAPGRELPVTLVKEPFFQHSTVMDVLTVRLVREEAARRGVEVSAEELAHELEKEPALASLASMSAEERGAVLRSMGLTEVDLEEVARDRALSPKLNAALVPAVEPEELWEAWRREHERVVLRFVRVPNMPASAAVTRFVDGQGEAIEAYYRAHPSRFATPVTRRARMILRRLGGRYSAADEARERTLLQELRGKVERKEAKFEALASTFSQDETASGGGAQGWVVPRQRPEAFGFEVGAVSGPVRTGEGLALFVAEEERPAAVAELDGGLRREIAAELIRQQGTVPETRALAAELVSAWKAAGPAGGPSLDAVLKRQHLRIEETLPFYPDEAAPEAFVPGIGELPGLIAVAARMTLTAWLNPEPLVDARDGSLLVVALMRRETTTREAFEVSEREGRFGATVLERRRQAARRVLLSQLGGDAMVDLGPIQARWGLVDKGAVRAPPPRPGSPP